MDWIYGTLLQKSQTNENTGSAAVLHQLQKSKRIAMLAITGMLHTTLTDFVDAHTVMTSDD